MSAPEPVPPRESARLVGQEAAETALLAALERGRLHHAWLLTGPEGVGKATFAYRAARRLLGAAPAAAYGLLGAEPQDPVFRQVAGRAHPDLAVLEIGGGEGRARKSIAVEDARGLPEFFSKSPGRAQYRVAIVDTADDLNGAAANAILKTLEEPPARGVLFLVSSRPGALLPTIRSRCRRLSFSPPPFEAASRWLTESAGLTPEQAELNLRRARGAPGRALRLASAGAGDIDTAARALIDRLPQIDAAAALALSDSFRGAQGAATFALAMDRMASIVREKTLARLEVGTAGLDRWTDAWSLLSDLPGEVGAVNLDRGDAFFAALERLAALG